MSYVDAVRSSRDGDQFHYLWAARRCLRLLAPVGGPIAITVEGPSLEEGEGGTDVADHVIDVGEYYGSEDIKAARLVRYLQLKHSTRRHATAWEPGELKPTLAAFAARFAALPRDVDRQKLTFEFISNRPVPEAIRATVEALGRSDTPADVGLARKLVGYTGLSEAEARSFYARVRLVSDEADFLQQRVLLNQEAQAFLNETDFDAPTILKEFVAWKATSAGEGNRSIRREDVLLKWGVAEENLFPAPSLIERPAHPVSRMQYQTVAADVTAAAHPVLIHAPAGVGKSVLSVCLGDLMPSGSVTVPYDCYGGGDYRQRGKSRHRPSDALVQVANELAAQSLCNPLIPVGHAPAKALLRSFTDRLRQAVTVIRARAPTGLLCLVFDAVDNAEMAAEEFKDGRSFAFDLLRESVPDGVRIVMLCRPERRHLLSPPGNVIQAPLEPFELVETEAHLLTRFPSASSDDAGEFHRLSSQNPRVQANALALDLPLRDILSSLGPNPTSVDDTISRQLEAALLVVKSEAGHDPSAVDRLCSAIAVLRPLIPIKFLADLSGLTVEAIASFATDFAGGRPLMVVGGDALQFRDEPVEDWFRRRYRPDQAAMRAFVSMLKPHASTSAYVAGNLPGLMLEADQFEDLVAMALSASGLPTSKGSQKREIEVQRLTFALRAAIHLKRWPEAVKLALRAGQENAGEKREQQLYQDQYDLTARFSDPILLQDAVAKRRVSSRWNGARYAREAAVLSGAPSLRMDARSRLRMSNGWLRAQFRLPKEDRENEDLKVEDLAALAFAEFNVHGPTAAANELMRWTPHHLRLELSGILARIFIDHGRWEDLDALLEVAALKKFGPVLAGGIAALGKVGRWPSRDVTKAVWVLGLGKTVIPVNADNYKSDKGVSTALAVAEAAIHHGVADDAEILARLKRRFPGKPDPSVGARFGEGRGDWLRLYNLRAVLEGRVLTPIDVAPERIRKQLSAETGHGAYSGDARDFKRVVGTLLPWWRLRAEQIRAGGRGSAFDLTARLIEARRVSTESKEHYEETGYDVDDQIAGVWFDILVRGGAVVLTAEFEAWAAAKGRPLFTTTMIKIARVAARSPGFEALAHSFTKEAAEITAKDHTETAESRLGTNVDICRALLALDPAEAEAYFDDASDIAVQVGDEAYSRWSALSALAAASEGAPASSVDKQHLAVRFARCAEFAQDHLDKHFSSASAMRRLVALSPSAAVGILSRWTDRDVGYLGAQLPGLIGALVERRAIPGTVAIAFLGFKGDWTYAPIVAAADRDVRPEDRSKLVADLIHYLTHSEPGLAEWRELAACFLDNADYTKTVAAEILAAKEREKQITTSFPRSRRRPKVGAWNKVFAGLDVATPHGLVEARRRSRAADGPSDSDGLWREAILRTPTGSEVRLIEAMTEADLSAFDARYILPNIPDEWLARRAPRKALDHLVEAVVRKEWQIVSRGHRYDILPLTEIERTTSLSQADVFLAAIEGAASEGDFGGVETIFGLVDLMSSLLTPDDAANALGYGMSLMEASIPDEYGEKWSPNLALPDNVEHALAGLLWTTLGSPLARRRWEAAHTVRSLLARPASSCLKRLAEFEAGASSAWFHSTDLPFYDLHARQWWLLALASAASRTPKAVERFADRLKQIAVRTNPHLIHRELSAKALLWLEYHEVAPLTLAEQAALLTINRSLLAGIEAEAAADFYGRDRETPRFYFPYEFGKSELVGLANCFVATKADISEAAEAVILDEWKVGFGGSWKDEPRRHQSMFREGRRRRSEEDAVHSYTDYLAMHAVITVGGRWLESRAPRISPHYPDDGSVAEWSDRFLPTRNDGLWISDVRSPAPAFRSRAERDKDWRWSVSKPELLNYLNEREVPVWGNWTDRHDSFSQDIIVRSALIKKGEPLALLAAAQTADEPWDCPLPRAGDGDWELKEPGFVLQGWIAESYGDTRIDSHDPWAAGMPHPPALPTMGVTRRLGLSVDNGAMMFMDRAERSIFKASIWSTPAGYDGEEQGPRGYRLVASRRRLPRLLRTLRADLLVCVSIQRERRRYNSEREIADGEIDYPKPYFLHLLVTRDGHFRTL
jgi:hypothetical protein